MKFLITFLFLLSYQSYGFNTLYPVAEDDVAVSQMASSLYKDGYRAVSGAQNSNQGDVIRAESAGNKNFANQDLKGKKFVGDFSNANFEGANLKRADFEKVTSFSGVSFKKANLKDAIFRTADLSGVDLRQAYLYRALFKPSVSN